MIDALDDLIAKVESERLRDENDRMRYIIATRED